MPILRTRVPRKLVRTRWLGVQAKAQLDQEIVEFQHYLRHDAEAEEQAMSHG